MTKLFDSVVLEKLDNYLDISLNRVRGFENTAAEEGDTSGVEIYRFGGDVLQDVIDFLTALREE